jgi:hypothetical protein
LFGPNITRGTRMRRIQIVGVALLSAVPFIANAADHIDSPSATAEPGADITDVYAWMSGDASKVNMVLDVHHMASADSAFSPAVQYALHINSAAAFGASESSEARILCQFYTPSAIECWLGDEYLEGDPSDPEGIVSQSGKLRVFAGRRDDPFFFELAGFKETVKTVTSVSSGLTFDAEGCPAVDAETAAALVGQLQSGPDGAAASNSFAGSSVLAIAVQVDKSLVTAGGPVLGVWASTHGAN